MESEVTALGLPTESLGKAPWVTKHTLLGDVLPEVSKLQELNELLTANPVLSYRQPSVPQQLPRCEGGDLTASQCLGTGRATSWE